MSGTSVRSLSRWQGRPVRHELGTWMELRELVPRFEKQDFAALRYGAANPYLRAIVRLPLSSEGTPVPVGTVGPDYRLIQHRELGDVCAEALRGLDLFYDQLPCTLSISELGEWVHIRFHLSDDLTYVPPDGHALGLCLDVYNSVDGSSRLVLLATWLRLVCENGLTLRQSSGFDDVHDRHLDLEAVRQAIHKAVRDARHDLSVLQAWWREKLFESKLLSWADGPLRKRWGKGSATRVLNICFEGWDGSAQPFDPAPPSSMGFNRTVEVPGAAVPAQSIYDVGQALSWVAGTRPNVEQQRAWLNDVPSLLNALRRQR